MLLFGVLGDDLDGERLDCVVDGGAPSLPLPSVGDG